MSTETLGLVEKWRKEGSTDALAVAKCADELEERDRLLREKIREWRKLHDEMYVSDQSTYNPLATAFKKCADEIEAILGKEKQ